jgi:arginase
LPPLRDAAAHLSRTARGFWIHVDRPSDDAAMPAVTEYLAGWFRGLEAVLTTALDSGNAVGLEITIYNPALDTDGRAGKVLADLLVSALSK